MLLTDGVHLVSDTSLEELHEFVDSIGMKRKWFQDHLKHPHYYLMSKFYRIVTDHGRVRIVDSRAIVLACRKLKGAELCKN